MYSAASVTDFDSDEDTYPYYNNSVSDSDSRSNSSRNSNSSSDNVSELNSRACHVLEFGEFEENYGWIQCRSKSYPDRVYYHNTRSGCNTWYRPISRYIDIPFVPIRRANCTGDILESAIDLELMAVSDDEKDLNVLKRASVRDRNKSLIDVDVSDIIMQYYYTPQINLSTDDSCDSNEFANECYERKNRADMKNENNENDADDLKAVCSPLYATNFLETEFFVGKDVVNTEGTNRIYNSLLEDASNRSKRVMYGMPRLKKIGFESQLIKLKRTRKSPEKPGPRKIISDMYGVRTISYDLPKPDEVCAAIGVKTTTLSASDSDSDENIPPLPSRHAKTMQFESEYRDIVKNLRQPLLSNSSSSSSVSSSTSRSSSSCSSSSSSSSNSGSSSSSSSSCSSSCSYSSCN